MANNQQDNKKQASGKQGGSHEQHVKAGEQSHKNEEKKSGSGQTGKSSQSNDKSKLSRRARRPRRALSCPMTLLSLMRSDIGPVDDLPQSEA